MLTRNVPDRYRGEYLILKDPREFLMKVFVFLNKKGRQK